MVRIRLKQREPRNSTVPHMKAHSRRADTGKHKPACLQTRMKYLHCKPETHLPVRRMISNVRRMNNADQFSHQNPAFSEVAKAAQAR